MARTKNLRTRLWSREVAVWLLVENSTAAGRGELAVGVTTRARRRRIAAAAAAAAALPDEILGWEIFVRLPAEDILRCRAVCRSWRGLTSAPDFLLAHHRRRPSLPLLTLDGKNSTMDGLPIFKHGRHLLGLDDYEDFKLIASCDGLLLVSLFDGQFSICNPTTRQGAPLPSLTTAAEIDIVALYLHRPSGEYRVLYWKDKILWYHPKAAYYILAIPLGQSPRWIGVPSDIHGIEKVMLSWHMTATNLATPISFNNCLHWDPGCDAGILVFDTVVESFRLMRRPDAATRLCTRLCDMEDSIGFSCYDDEGRRIIKIWVLEDYGREVWSFKYQVELPVESPCYYANSHHLVLSHKGDVLVYWPSGGYMFHSDRNGKLLEEFQCDSWGLSIIGHRFKESLVKHHISHGQGCDLFFQSV